MRREKLKKYLIEIIVFIIVVILITKGLSFIKKDNKCLDVNKKLKVNCDTLLLAPLADKKVEKE